MVKPLGPFHVGIQGPPSMAQWEIWSEWDVLSPLQDLGVGVQQAVGDLVEDQGLPHSQVVDVVFCRRGRRRQGQALLLRRGPGLV